MVFFLMSDIFIFRASIVQDNGTMKQEEIQTSILLNRAIENDVDKERVSTGTKYALSEWLKMTAAV